MTSAQVIYSQYVKENYTKGTIIRVRKVAQYNWEGNIFVAVHHVEDDGTIIAYTCHGEYWEVKYGDTFAKYIPMN